jgi:acetate CoA/acetoacetate CoA-transferase beta subunit
MKTRLEPEVIAMRAAKEFRDGDCVNLGLGIGGLCANFIPEGRTVFFQSETGVVGYGHVLTEEEADKADIDLIDASGQFVATKSGMCFMDHAMAMAIPRGGHLNVSVLGALQVSEKGDLANWSLGDPADCNIGGAMDSVAAKKVIICMTHTNKKGEPKILKKCTLPLTCPNCVDLIITDIAVIEVTKDGLLLKEVAPGGTPEEVQASTEPQLIVADDLKEIEL